MTTWARGLVRELFSLRCGIHRLWGQTVVRARIPVWSILRTGSRALGLCEIPTPAWWRPSGRALISRILTSAAPGKCSRG